MDAKGVGLLLYDLIHAGIADKSCRKAEKFWEAVMGESGVYCFVDSNTINDLDITFSYDEGNDDAKMYAELWIQAITLINEQALGDMRFKCVRISVAVKRLEIAD